MLHLHLVYSSRDTCQPPGERSLQKAKATKPLSNVQTSSNIIIENNSYSWESHTEISQWFQFHQVAGSEQETSPDLSPCLHICASTQCKKHCNSGYHLPKLASHFSRVRFVDGLVNGFQGHGADQIQQRFHASNDIYCVYTSIGAWCETSWIGAVDALSFPNGTGTECVAIGPVAPSEWTKKEPTSDLNSSIVSEHLRGGLLLDSNIPACWHYMGLDAQNMLR